MKKKRAKNLVVVLGMHRSGTSAVTRGLQALGVDLGESLIPAVAGDNDKGFFEDIEVNTLNNDLLHYLHSDWHALSPLAGSALLDREQMASFKVRAIELLRDKMGLQPFGLKDPRISRLLPFWQDVFTHLQLKVSYVIAVRHPKSVARSLQRRDGFDAEKSYYLWLMHVLPSILQTSGTDRIVVDFDMLMAEPRGQLERIGRALHFAPLLDGPQLDEYMHGFLENGLRHSRFEFEDLLIDPAVPGDVVNVYRLLLRLAQDQVDNDITEIKEIFTEIAAHLEGMAPAFHYMTRFEGKIDDERRKVTQLELQRDGLNQHIVTLSEIVAARESTIDEYQEHADNLNLIADELKQQISAREADIVALGGQLADLHRQLQQRQDKLSLVEKEYWLLHEQQNRIIRSIAYKGLHVAGGLVKKIPGSGRLLQHIASVREKRQALLQQQRVAASGLFHENYYLVMNPAVKKTKVEPLHHFMTVGAFQGCRPNPWFDPAFYLATYPDVAASGINPLLHYIQSGQQEGRVAQALLSSMPKAIRTMQRYASGQTVLVVCSAKANVIGENDSIELLRWLYRCTALDVRVVVLGAWQRRDLGVPFPQLCLDPSASSPTVLSATLAEFAGDTVKAVYCDDVAGLACTGSFAASNISIFCAIRQQLEKVDCLQQLSTPVRFLTTSPSAVEWLTDHVSTMHEIVDLSEGRPADGGSPPFHLFAEKLLWQLRTAGIKPAVSVIVPNYNHADFLPERLDSIYAQTFRDFEVLLLDDCSNDQSVAILNNYAASSPHNTRFFFNHINSGSVFKQWAKGIGQAQGEILWIAESDDLCAETFLEQMLPTMNSDRVMVSYCQSYCMGGAKHEAMTYIDMGYYDSLGRDRWFHDHTVNSGREITSFLAVHNIIPNVSSALLRNIDIETILEESQRFTVSGDWYFYIRHTEGGRLAYLAEPLNYHRLHAGSVVSNNRNEGLFNEFKEMHLWVANRYQLSPETKEKMRSYVAAFVWPGLEGKQKKKFEEAYPVELLEGATPGKVPPVLRQRRPVTTDLKPIAMYLPQFHAIPENDAWWGKGFTEWTNTRKAQPFYTGHLQPREPHPDFGYYDLSDWRILQQQTALAKEYGIFGFCFYHYWFDGTRLLEKPVDLFLQHSEIDFPFCLCWANENWTRCWDGFNKDILKAQNHSLKDDLSFIIDLSRYLRDPRYIRIDGKLLLVIYRPELLPMPLKSVKLWRDWCRENGLGELYLVYMQGFGNPEDPRSIGFDATMEFPPLIPYNEEVFSKPPDLHPSFTGLTLSYPAYARQVMIRRKMKHYDFPFFRSVMMAWDNTARRNERATIFTDFSLQTFTDWLKDTVSHARSELSEDRRLFFINAWNEWAEGTYLEPDQVYGYSILETVRSAISRVQKKESSIENLKCVGFVCHDAHIHGAQLLSLHLVRTLKEKFNYHVYLFLLHDGELKEQFEKYASVLLLTGYSDKQKLTQFLKIHNSGVNTVYCNTVVSGSTVKYFNEAGFTVVSLIHELASVITTCGLINEAKAITQYSDVIIFPSEIVASSFNKISQIESSKYIIRPQGVYFDNPYKNNRKVAKHEICKNLNIPFNGKIVLAVGYAELRKGVDIFIQIANIVLSVNKDSYFVWVGKRENQLAAWIDHDIAKYKIKENVLFVDATREIGPFFAAADVFVLTSREDPFPSVLMEAMAVGTPVIGFQDAGGFSDIVDGTNGFLVPYLSVEAMALAITQLINDENKCNEMGKKGIALIENKFNFCDYVKFLLSFDRIRTSV